MRYMFDDTQFSEDDDEAEVRNYFAQERGHMRLSVGDYYQEHKAVFPTIYRMAKDYLSMMPISHPSKSLLTKVENMFIDKQDQLPPDAIKKLVILKSRGEVKDEASIYRYNEYE